MKEILLFAVGLVFSAAAGALVLDAVPDLEPVEAKLEAVQASQDAHVEELAALVAKASQ